MSQPMPRIEIRPLPEPAARGTPADLLATLIEVLRRRGGGDRWIGSLVSGLVAEGRRFAETDSGRRWTSVLAASQLATNGWMLWNMLDLDRYVTARDMGTEDTPAAMVEDLLREVGSARLEELIRLMTALAVEGSDA